MMKARALLKRVYDEIGTLESLRRQRAMVIEDNAGMQAIRYDAVKVCGGHQGDLSEVMENIEQQAKRIDMLIAKQLECIMIHRQEAYELLEKLPGSPGKSALQEHYLYRVPWAEVSQHLNFGKAYIRQMAYKCLEELEAMDL